MARTDSGHAERAVDMKKKLKSSGFQSPNYTQTPNDFFSLINDMDEPELRVTLVMIRATFGFHRNSFKMGVKKLAKAAGLSLNGARAGADAAEERGTFRRTNADAQGEAEWELIVEDAVNEWGVSSEGEGVHGVNGGGASSEPQSPIKESIKERIKKDDDEGALAQSLKDVAMKELSKAYQSEIGMITPMIADELRDAIDTHPSKWIMDAIHESALQNKRGWKYVLAILTRWKAQGNQEEMKPQQFKKQAVSEPAAFEAIRQFEAMQNGR